MIDRARRDEPEAWQRLIAIYRPLVYYWCRRQANLPPEDAADVMQEVFLAVARNMASFRRRERGNFRGWLRAITSSKVGDHFRRAARHPAAAGGSDFARLLHALPDTGPSHSQPPSAANGSERAVVLHATLEQIREQFTSPCWQAFWRVHIEGRPRDETARELGMSVAAVNQATYRVRRRLKEELTACAVFEE